ncbi:unnamed protein product [Durusdinium trenchii]|uniref:EEF1A lysine and N-terminal methyltransferase (Methyltransferase-like protein 13) n=2 Tax=Durusdinium trenchii TaxID=1381693 RepID=A0ABP0I4L9_9DINO
MTTVERYANPDFWDARFQGSEGLFDWYATYAELKDTFEEFYPAEQSKQSSPVLVVGCGNSAFSSELYAAGYLHITSIDISASAISKMQEQFNLPGMSWQVMDATAMSFQDGTFNLAVDKGTLDAMMTSGSDEIAGAMVSEIWRVLQPDGLLILISHSGKRLKLLTDGWQCLELRRCRLSPQATFINMLRSKLPPGAPLRDAFQQPELLQEAGEEAKQALRKMAFIDAFRVFKARKRAQAGLSRTELVQAEEELRGAKDEGSDPRRQPFCWIYVLRKIAR